LDYNVYWDTSDPEIKFAGMSFKKWQAKGQDIHSIIADPMFVDAEGFDFRLKPESPAFNLEFKQIDTSENGLYGPPEWVDRPGKTRR